jgi:hypothetical protein
MVLLLLSKLEGLDGLLGSSFDVPTVKVKVSCVDQHRAGATLMMVLSIDLMSALEELKGFLADFEATGMM